MTTNQYRRSGEADARTKETGRNPGQDATHEQNDSRNSTVERSRETERERGLYLPLLWAELGPAAKPAKCRGKGKRQVRAAAIRAKRGNQGAIDLQLISLIALAAVAGLLLAGGL